MDVLEAIQKRKSIRGFKPDPVSKEVLARIVEAACRAPSAMNTQPWEFLVLTGEVLDAVRNEIVARLRNREPMQPEHHVVGWSNDSVYRDRQVELAKRIFRLMEIPRENKEKRAAWLERGFRFFDAPAAIILLTDRSLRDEAPLLDMGAVMENICLAALHFGLGTCIEDQGLLYPRTLREHLRIPGNKKMIIAIAVGYPDDHFPANRLETDREPVETVVRWFGFDR